MDQDSVPSLATEELAAVLDFPWVPDRKWMNSQVLIALAPIL